MTTSINLLPWREELREERKQAFLVSLVVVVLVAAGILFSIHLYFQAAIENQKARNTYLTEQIAILDVRLTEIRELRRQKDELAARMAVIQDLQGTRPVIVRLFDQLVRTMPEGVYYTRISRTDESIRLEGIADSNNTISALMRELDASEWFASPVLSTVNTLKSGAEGEIPENSFVLTVQITRPALTPAQDQPQ